MKYLLIFAYIGQFCAPPNTPISGPPFYYMRSFDTYKEADDARNNLETEEKARAAIVYGFPQFDELDKEPKCPS